MEIRGVSSAAHAMNSAVGTTAHEESAPVSKQDQMDFSKAWQQFMGVSNRVSTMSSKAEQLSKILRNDTAFAEDRRRSFLSNPVGRELAKELILNDPELQEEIAKNMWESYQMISPSYSAANHLYIPASYKEFNVKAMLMNPDSTVADQVFIGYNGVLNKKACTFGLTDTERLLSGKAEEIELAATGTFNQQMGPVMQAIQREFEAAGMTFDARKKYSFHLDTSVFQFTVSGGTEDENALIEKVINTSNYHEDHFQTTLAALYSHRLPDGKYTPWRADNFRHQDAIPVYGIASVSKDYAQKMEQLFAAHDRCRMDLSLKEEYGFGVDDLMQIGGTVTGKTKEVSEIIREMGEDFMKNIGYAYIGICKRYQGTPEFTDDVFTLENGQFQTSYTVYDQNPPAGATDSAAILAEVTKNLEAKAAAEAASLEAGRMGLLMGKNGEKKTAVEVLFNQIKQDSNYSVGKKKRFYDYPAARSLAKELILSNDNLLDTLSRNLWEQYRSTEKAPFWPLRAGGVDITAMLENEDSATQVFRHYDALLTNKRKNFSLTELEQLLNIGY